jgi:hypothetical protein
MSVVGVLAAGDEQLLSEHDGRQRHDGLDRVVEQQERHEEPGGTGQGAQCTQRAAELAQRPADLLEQRRCRVVRLRPGQRADGVEPAHGDQAEQQPPQP